VNRSDVPVQVEESTAETEISESGVDQTSDRGEDVTQSPYGCALDELLEAMNSLSAEDPARLALRNEVVDRCFPLAVHLAQRFQYRGEPFDDLLQVASVGLIKAVNRFDSSRGTAFSSFAMPTILGELKRHFRDTTWSIRIPRTLQELRPLLLDATEHLRQELGRAPTVAEIAARMGVSEDAALDAMEAANAYSAASLDETVDGDSGALSVIERLGEVDDGFDLVEARMAAAPLLDALCERDRRILFLRYYRDMTQAEIAREVGISQMHVSRLLTQIVGRLNSQLTAALKACDAA
jgi:RNA polymerase sigma-B factor